MYKSTVTMKINTFNLVLVLVVTVTGFHSAFGQQCKVGEPKPLEVEPDLNITISPLAGQVGEQLQITCDAGLPRFPLSRFARPLPATRIIISHDGIPANALKTCQDASGITQCTFTLTLAENTINRAVCQAINSGGQCRFKFTEFDILKKSVSSTLNLQTVDSSSFPTVSSTLNLQTVDSSSFPIVSPSVNLQVVDSSSFPTVRSSMKLRIIHNSSLPMSSTVALQTSKSLKLQSTRYVNATPSVPDSKAVSSSVTLRIFHNSSLPMISTVNLQTPNSLKLESSRHVNATPSVPDSKASTPFVTTSSTTSLPTGSSSKENPEVMMMLLLVALFYILYVFKN